MFRMTGFLRAPEDGSGSGGGAPIDLSGLFEGGEVGTPAEKVVEASPAKVEAVVKVESTPAAAVETGESAFLKWMKEAYPEAPDGVVKVDNWKTQRDLNARMAKEFGATSLELAQAKRELAEAKKGGGAALPETEAVKKLTADLETLRVTHQTELSEWTAHKAKQELEGVDAFRREFDGKRVAMMEGAKEVAGEAGVAPEVVDKVFAATTELQLVKALNEIEDPDAKALIAEKARSFLSLTKQRDAAVTKDPVNTLKQWKDYEETVKGATAKGFTANFSNKLLAALPTVAAELKDDPFMSTAAGQAVMARLSAMFTGGAIPNEQSLVKALAQAESATVYRDGMAKAIQTAAAHEKRVAELEKALSKYERIDPAQGGAGAGVRTTFKYDAGRHFD